MSPLSIGQKLLASAAGFVMLTGLLYGGFVYVKHLGYAECEADLAKQVKVVDEKREAVAPPIIQKQIEVQTKIQYVTKTIVKEVPVYVKATDCPMPGGFRVLHDAAANGEIPDPTRIPDAAPVPAQDVASTIADNYGTCHESNARLVGLQDWVKAQQALKR